MLFVRDKLTQVATRLGNRKIVSDTWDHSLVVEYVLWVSGSDCLKLHMTRVQFPMVPLYFHTAIIIFSKL